MKKTIGIIGFGNMGSAIAFQLSQNEFKVYSFDKDSSKINNSEGVEFTGSIAGIIDKCEIIILAVKPQDFSACLEEIKPCRHLQDKLFISIAAGVTTSFIEKILGVIRVVRAMPNMPLKINRSMTCLAKGKYATEEDFDISEDLFEYLGEVLGLDESMMNQATAISGSGPGWYFDAIETRPGEYGQEHERFVKQFIIDLKEAAKAVGFSDSEAAALSATTIMGSDALIKNYGKSGAAAALKKLVASRGGTTEAGLEVLHNNGSLTDAAKAAVKRAEELSKE